MDETSDEWVVSYLEGLYGEHAVLQTQGHHGTGHILTPSKHARPPLSLWGQR
jgi:hypothetical protein